MNQTKLFALLGLILIVLLTAASTIYTVDEREKAVIVRFGQVIRYDDPPGLHFKTPFLDTVRFYDARILTMDLEPQTYLTKEKKNLVVDSYVKWRIVDLLKFYVAVGGDELGAKTRLAQVIHSGFRDEFGKRTLHDAISNERRKIMEALTVNADKDAREYGIQVLDVRLQRVDLPPEVSPAVYERMKAERSRIANELRAQGAETAEKIRAEAERKREVLLADAYRKGESMRGDGDARATAIYGAAAGKAPEFYSLYRSLNAYKESFRKKDDIMIVDPSADFFRYMKKPSR